jgi:hypothetical protein
MPASTNLISDDRFLMELTKFSLDSRVSVIPWRSINSEGGLNKIDIPLGQSLIYNFSWTIPSIVKKISSLKPTKVFCCSPSKNLNFEQVPFPYYVGSDILHSDKKDIMLSFIGWNNSKLRNRIFEIYKDRSVFIPMSKFNDKEGRKTFCSVLARSKFSLCPRGLGSGTYRFWESLKAGAIPILLSDEYILPNGWDWENTIIRLKESDLQFNLKIDAAINKARLREELMRENCIKAYNFFLNPENLCKYINNNL